MITTRTHRTTTACFACAAALAGAAAAHARPLPAEPFAGDAPQFGVGYWGSLFIPMDGTGPGMQAAADHVISQQCLDDGWGWPHADCSTTFHNITAPIAMGLLRIWEVTDDAATLASAEAAGDFDLTFTYPGGEARFGSYTPAFMRLLSAALGDTTYSDHAETEFFDELTAGTYGDPDFDTYGWIGAVESARSGSFINLRPWDFHNLPWVAAEIGNADSTTPADGVAQSDAFEGALLDGLDTLEEGLQYDLLGLAGGIRGLALNGTTTFSAISAALFDDIDGITDLCDLADALVSFQNSDGSWSWRSDLQDPVDETDKDTQTTAYAVLALLAADEAGCTPVPGGRYNSEIAAGRSFLDSMQEADGGFTSYPGGSHNIEAESEAMHAATVAPLSLNTSACESSGTVTVTIDMAAMPDEIVGGQFFLEYDNSVLDFDSASVGDAPFDLEVFESVDEIGGTIEYAVGVTGGGPGTSSATTMAVLEFLTLTEVCTPTADLVTWDRDHAPPSRLTNSLGDEFLATLADLGATTIDETPPVITPPSDIEVNADAGGCDADVAVPALSASDACTGVASIVNDYNGTADASDVYPSGTTMVTWTVTDECGNVSMITQDVTVNAVNDLAVDVELASVTDSFTRCITFEFWECPDTAPAATVTEELVFAGGSFSGTIEVPCGSYTCVTARDALHTLRRTDDDGDFTVSGTIYVADFTSTGTTDDSLVGGNLNDDFFIDILDFGIFVGQNGTSPGADTLCSAVGPHADISGNGTVFTEDFSFISLNFLESHEPNCCGAPLALYPPFGPAIAISPQPVTRISVAELRARGLDDLIVADLNHDGWLDVLDMEAYANGARP